jgi:hypothetical protein
MSRVESITVAPTLERQSTPGRFEAALQGATRSLSASIVGAVELAAPAVPFGTVLAGAVRSAAGPQARVPLGRTGAAGMPVGSAAAGVPVGTVPAGVSGATAAASQGDLLEATRALQQESQAMNLQYLQLQEQMQQESREFTALSNVMRVKHDSARNAIANIH